MNELTFRFPNHHPLVVGSFGDYDSLRSGATCIISQECDIAEIRLDLVHKEYLMGGTAIWSHLADFPLLFTARCHAEGSPFQLDLETRKNLIRAALPSASLIDIEVASIEEMSDLVAEIHSKGIPWIASYHDFERLPTLEELKSKANAAWQAGAAAFKFAGRLHKIEDLPAITSLQTHDYGIPVAGMGMGSLGPVSRLLCAQNGSCLNYGYLGKNETAPGQWPAKLLREGILASASLKNDP